MTHPLTRPLDDLKAARDELREALFRNPPPLLPEDMGRVSSEGYSTITPRGLIASYVSMDSSGKLSVVLVKAAEENPPPKLPDDYEPGHWQRHLFDAEGEAL